MKSSIIFGLATTLSAAFAQYCTRGDPVIGPIGPALTSSALPKCGNPSIPEGLKTALPQPLDGEGDSNHLSFSRVKRQLPIITIDTYV
jgi:hypothetical protein